MEAPFVIAINATSGGGKTSLATLVHESLPNSALFRFDDFDASNIFPADYYEWWIRGGDLEEFDCPGMRAAVDIEIQSGKTQYIVMDYPFGRDHSRFREVIHLSVWLQTPLDIAMARRILRDLDSSRDAIPPQELIERLKKDLNHYLVKSRSLYADDSHMRTADLVLEGGKPLAELRDRILEAIEMRSKRGR